MTAAEALLNKPIVNRTRTGDAPVVASAATPQFTAPVEHPYTALILAVVAVAFAVAIVWIITK